MKKLFILLLCAGVLGCSSNTPWLKIDGKPLTMGDMFLFNYDSNECRNKTFWSSAFEKCMRDKGYQRKEP